MVRPMVFSLKKIKEWMRFLFLFVLFTLFLYQLITLLAPLFRPNTMYKEPSEGAVKVFAHARVENEAGVLDEIRERLFLFYWLGE